MLTDPQKLRLLLAFNLTVVTGYFLTFDVSIFLLVYGIFYGVLLNILGNNIGLHRYFSHSSFKTKHHLLLKFFSTVCGLGSQINYCIIHRQHHKFSDTELDPHNPKEIGILRSLTMTYKPVAINPNIVRDLFNDQQLKFLHRYYYHIIIGWILILSAVSIEVMILFFALPALMCWVSAVSIGVIPHLFGYRDCNTKDNSHNNILASILSVGEGWHNYHHSNPKDYKHSTKWWEFDPASKIIDWIKVAE